MKYALIYIIILICSTSLHAKAKQTRAEHWDSTPGPQCSRVKVISRLTEDSLKIAIINKLSQHGWLDQQHSSATDFTTKDYQFENHQYHLRYQISGSTVIISGEYSVMGFGVSWIKITRGNTSNTIRTPWEQMDPATGGLSSTQILYSNK